MRGSCPSYPRATLNKGTSRSIFQTEYYTKDILTVELPAVFRCIRLARASVGYRELLGGGGKKKKGLESLKCGLLLCPCAVPQSGSLNTKTPV